MKDESRAVTIDLGEGRTVSGLQLAPEGARACYVLAHGAGAGMTHPFLAACAGELGARGIATLRFQFPYMEAKSKRPDPPSSWTRLTRRQRAMAFSRGPAVHISSRFSKWRSSARIGRPRCTSNWV